jgi:hypothetical protein
LPELRIRPGPGDSRYSFRCEKCNSGKQYFRHKEKQWLDIALTGLYNLQLSENRRFFHVKRELCAWVLKNWDEVCVGRTKTVTWWATLNAQITTRPDLFETESYGSGKWALRGSPLSASSTPPSSAGSNLTSSTQRSVEDSPLVTTHRNVISLQENAAPASSSPRHTGEHSQDPISSDDELSDAPASKDVSSEERTAEYPVVKILSRRTLMNKKSQYQVQWEHGKLTWEDVETFASLYPHIATDFERRTTTEPNAMTTLPLQPTLLPPKRRRHRRLKPFSSLWCHQCKQKHADVVYCSRFLKGTCSKKYCKGCLARHYNEELNEEDKQTWICIYCRNSCTCASCRRKRGEEAASNSRSGVGRKRRRVSSKFKANKRIRHIQNTLVTSSHIERILARIEKGDQVKYLVQLKDSKTAPYVWVDRKDMDCPNLLATFDHGLKISVPASLLLQFNKKLPSAPHRRRKSYTTTRTNRDFDLDRIVSYDAAPSRRIVLPKKQNIAVPGFVDIGYRTDEQIQQLLKDLPPDESDEDTSDECYLCRHTPYEEREQERWKQHMVALQGTDGVRGSRATSSFMKKNRIEGEAKVTLKDLLDAGILTAGEEFTFKGQVSITLIYYSLECVSVQRHNEMSTTSLRVIVVNCCRVVRSNGTDNCFRRCPPSPSKWQRPSISALPAPSTMAGLSLCVVDNLWNIIEICIVASCRILHFMCNPRNRLCKMTACRLKKTCRTTERCWTTRMTNSLICWQVIFGGDVPTLSATPHLRRHLRNFTENENVLLREISRLRPLVRMPTFRKRTVTISNPMETSPTIQLIRPHSQKKTVVTTITITRTRTRTRMRMNTTRHWFRTLTQRTHRTLQLLAQRIISLRCCLPRHSQQENFIPVLCFVPKLTEEEDQRPPWACQQSSTPESSTSSLLRPSPLTTFTCRHQLFVAIVTGHSLMT